MTGITNYQAEQFLIPEDRVSVVPIYKPYAVNKFFSEHTNKAVYRSTIRLVDSIYLIKLGKLSYHMISHDIT